MNKMQIIAENPKTPQWVKDAALSFQDWAKSDPFHAMNAAEFLSAATRELALAELAASAKN